MQFSIALIDDSTGEMCADITKGDQSPSGQIDQDALLVLVGIVEHLPFVLFQLANFRNRNRLYARARRKRTQDSQHTRCQKEGTRAGNQEAQCIAAGNDLILIPGIRKFLAPFALLLWSLRLRSGFGLAYHFRVQFWRGGGFSSRVQFRINFFRHKTISSQGCLTLLYLSMGGWRWSGPLWLALGLRWFLWFCRSARSPGLCRSWAFRDAGGFGINPGLSIIVSAGPWKIGRLTKIGLFHQRHQIKRLIFLSHHHI